MNRLISMLSPSITTMIRLDHTHVVATFQQVHPRTPRGRKQALVGTVCMALEIHAQLEEELFYPAMRRLPEVQDVVDKSVPEHGEMRRLVTLLRGMLPADPLYDETFMALTREVLHHVADEETTLLPAAERLLPWDHLKELGAQMTKRRLQLLGPRAGDLAWATVRSMPESGLVLASAAVAATAQAFSRVSPFRRP
jgi:hypothetical protein